MAEFVRRITIVGSEGRQEARTVFKKKKRKVSKWLRPMERRTRKMIEAQQTVLDELLDRHNRSNRKRRDGWLRDAGLNTMRSQRKGLKKLRKVW